MAPEIDPVQVGRPATGCTAPPILPHQYCASVLRRISGPVRRCLAATQPAKNSGVPAHSAGRRLLRSVVQNSAPNLLSPARVANHCSRAVRPLRPSWNEGDCSSFGTLPDAGLGAGIDGTAAMLGAAGGSMTAGGDAAAAGRSRNWVPRLASSARLSHAISPGDVMTIRPTIAAGTSRSDALRAIAVVTAMVRTVSPAKADALCTPTLAVMEANLSGLAANYQEAGRGAGTPAPHQDGHLIALDGRCQALSGQDRAAARTQAERDLRSTRRRAG